MVIKLTHESIIADHLTIKRTIQEVLSALFLPGIARDINRFCQSCDICQRTVPKGKIIKAPLGKIPRIDVPFRRVAMDLVGPLEPRSHSKNRYILTLVDYALVSIFSRVGIPSKILTDR